MRPRGTKQDLETRRRTAVALRKTGKSIRYVARQVGCVPSSVVRWTQTYEREGPDGLKSKPQAGSKPRLSSLQKEALCSKLLDGACTHGWESDLWTLKRVAELILREFGVEYHISSAHRLLHELGFSAQKPTQQPREQSRKAIEEFRKKRWPAIKGGPNVVVERLW